MTFMLAFQMTLRQVDRLGGLTAACKGHLSRWVIYVCLGKYARGRNSQYQHLFIVKPNLSVMGQLIV